MTDLLKELLTSTYSQTVKDNEEDFKTVLFVITKLVSTLVAKKIITEDEMNFILELEAEEKEQKDQILLFCRKKHLEILLFFRILVLKKHLEIFWT